MERADDAGTNRFSGAGEQGQGSQRDFGVDSRGVEHFDEVAEKAEAGDVGASGDAVAAQTEHGFAAGEQHGLNRLFDPCAFGLASHIGGEEASGTEGLSEDQGLAGLEGVFA